MWLDLTINKGNSGGPLILLGKKPKDDKVIGITTFITTPYFAQLEDLNRFVELISQNTEYGIGGINLYEYVHLINSALNSNSVGISGAVSLDAVIKEIKKIK